MLTGDKLETAENIGRSCQLVQEQFTVMRIEAQEQPDKEKFKNYVAYQIRVAKGIFERCTARNIPKALLIEGESLGMLTRAHTVL